MEPLFEVQGIMDDDHFRCFQRTVFQGTMQKAYRTLTVVLYAVAVLSLLMQDFLIAFSLAVLATFFLLFPKINEKTFIKQMRETSKVSYMKPYTIRFFEQDFTEFTPNGQQTVAYHEIYRVFESEEAFVILISAAQGYVIKKSEFTRGRAEAFSHFLRMQQRVNYKFV